MSARRGPFRALFPFVWSLTALALAAGAACAPRGTAQQTQAQRQAQSQPARPVPSATARILASHPHDPNAFTQGLLVRDGRMFESDGQYGQSGVREVDLATGRTIRRVAIPEDQFGEGLADFGNELISLTWRNGIAHRWSLPGLSPRGQSTYAGEGWGLTSNGRELILSDGTPELRILDPRTFAVRRTVTVTAAGERLSMLNELEWVDGELLANVWHEDRIARIDPATGRVKGWIDLTPLVRATPVRDSESVANGIAWDAKARRLYVTGKNWPKLYRIAWPVD